MDAQRDLVLTLTTLNRIADVLNRAGDLSLALNSSLAMLVELMGLETGWVFLKDPAAKSQWAGRGYVLAAHHRLPPALALNRAAAWRGDCDCQELCNKGQLSEAVNQVRCSRLASGDGADNRGLTVHASAPLRSGDQVLGILNVAAESWDAFDPEALALLTNVGSLMGIAVERWRLFQMLQERRIGEQAALLELSNQLLSRPRLPDLMSYLVAEVRRLLQVDACALVMPAEEPGMLAYAAATGWRMDPVARRRRIPDDENNSASLAMRTQLPVVAEDITEDPLAPYLPGWLRAEEFRGHAAMPLLVEGRAIGALVIDARRPQLFGEDDLRFFRLMANQAAIAIERSRLVEEELKHQRLSHELALGKQIQRQMLPLAPPEAAGWDFAVHCEAARQVGGDFYDYFWLPGSPQRLGIVIGDVADKGVPAALFMAMSRSLIRSTAFSGRSPAAALVRTNELILKDSQTDLFLSAVYAVLDLETGQVVYTNAGHNRPVVWRSGRRRLVELDARGIVLGAFEAIALEERRLRLAPGDFLVLYTDGITEASNAQGEFFGKERLYSVLSAGHYASAAEVAEAVLSACSRFAGGVEQSDDITLVVAMRKSNA